MEGSILLAFLQRPTRHLCQPLLGLDEESYTPQMIVDRGTSEFVGSDVALADKAFAKALTKPKLAVRLSSASLGSPNLLQAHLETDAFAGILQLARGRRLHCRRSQPCGIASRSRRKRWTYVQTHTAVVRSIVKVGTLRQRQAPCAGYTYHRLRPGTDAHNLRVIAFVQEPGQGQWL